MHLGALIKHTPTQRAVTKNNLHCAWCLLSSGLTRYGDRDRQCAGPQSLFFRSPEPRDARVSQDAHGGARQYVACGHGDLIFRRWSRVYGVATISRLFKIISLFCKRAL